MTESINTQIIAARGHENHSTNIRIGSGHHMHSHTAADTGAHHANLLVAVRPQPGHSSKAILVHFVKEKRIPASNAQGLINTGFIKPTLSMAAKIQGQGTDALGL